MKSSHQAQGNDYSELFH